jgi:hypothetical protein
MRLAELAVKDGQYVAEIWKPAASGGLVDRQEAEVHGGSAALNLPSFVDDLVVHLYRPRGG